ncbi:MAG TPA: ElyC/SanA/YdcF family protein [Steroidobacteraceae bacterium]|nr:ElyC/SanA/YdcF family protein [Steroidobacteraceae bacterium]
MYAFKQLVGTLAMPLVIAMLLAIVAVAFRALHWRRTSRSLLIVAAVIAWLAALPVTGEALLSPLESRYAPLDVARWDGAATQVVVLGSSYTPHDNVPVTGALDDEALARGVEGITLFRRLRASRLVLSGGAIPAWQASARGYEVLARSLGVDAESLIVLDRSLDTDDEARAVHALLGATPFILVTSACHMPRAVLLMERVGAHPIPAPTGQRVWAGRARSLRNFLPSSRGLRKTELALHEYLGLLALKVGFDD